MHESSKNRNQVQNGNDSIAYSGTLTSQLSFL